MRGATARPLLAILIFLAGSSFAFGQAGSIGGTIGKTDKSVTGAEAPRKIQTTKKSLPRAHTGSPSRRGGRDGDVAKYDGAWTAVISPGCAHSGTLAITVSGGRIKGFGMSGTISPTAAFRTVGLDGTVTSGRITGNRASGSYREPDGCSGSIRAIKN